MKVWTVILAGVLLAALPNLGSGVLNDAGVLVAKTYPNFQMRTLPVPRSWACTIKTPEYSWWRIDLFESLLLGFQRGDNTMNATFSLGTPSLLVADKTLNGQFIQPSYCKYLPTRYQNATLFNRKVVSVILQQQINYFAVKVNNTARATIETGWNYLKTVVKNQFPTIAELNLYSAIVEKTAAGKVYVGAVQLRTNMKRKDNRIPDFLMSYLH